MICWPKLASCQKCVCEWRKNFTMGADNWKSNARSLLNEFPALSLARSVNLFIASIVIRWKIVREVKKEVEGKKKFNKRSKQEIGHWTIWRREEKQTIYWLHERDLRAWDHRQKSSVKVKQGKYTYMLVNSRVNVYVCAWACWCMSECALNSQCNEKENNNFQVITSPRYQQ